MRKRTFIVGATCTGALGLAIGCSNQDSSASATSAAVNGVYDVQIQGTSLASLPICNTSTAGETAYVSTPPGLYSCIANHWFAIPCTTLLSGAVAYASATQSLWACSRGQWTPVTLPGGPMGAMGAAGATGPTGATGATGAAGAAGSTGAAGGIGAQGTPGAQGDAGAQGTPGATSLLKITPVAPGAACPAGGEEIDVGIDTNGDGVLEANEVQQTGYVCNGDATAQTTSFNDTTCSSTVAPNVALGFFVDGANGNDATGNGSESAPVKTLAAAIPIAQSLGRTSVYVAEGTYNEGLTLPAGSALFVEGGWLNAAGRWTRDCSSAANTSTILTGSVVSSVTTGGIRALDVKATGGVSNEAVRVAAGKLSILYSTLEAAAGANGAAVTAGANGANGNNSFVCSSGGAGSNGSNGAIATIGVFLSDGTYVPANGKSGTGGWPGQNGTAGAYLEYQSAYCGVQYSQYYYQCNCGPFNGCSTCTGSEASGCSVQSEVYSSFQSTNCGHGGAGGAAGVGGNGGGASVALAVGVGAQVNVVGSSLAAQQGGGGSNGSSGGSALAGSSGSAQTVSSFTSCTFNSDSSCTANNTPVTSTAGAGGNGGQGGSGGNGAGGPSYAVVEVGTGLASLDAATTLSFATGGAGASGAPNGQAAATFAQP